MTKTKTAKAKAAMAKKAKAEAAAAMEAMVSIKKALFDRAELKHMLEAASQEFFSSYSGFRDQPKLPVKERFDSLCKHHRWDLKQVSKHLSRFLAFSLAKYSPGLFDQVVENDFELTFAIAFGGLKKPIKHCSAKAKFEALAREQHWVKGGEVYKRRYEACRSRFYLDCALEVQAHPGYSKVLRLGKDNKVSKVVLSTKVDNKNNTSKSSLPTSKSSSSEIVPRNEPSNDVTTDTLAIQFGQLALKNQWTDGSKQFRKQRGEFFTKRFEEEWSEIVYAPDENEDEDGDSVQGVDISKVFKLSQWQNLCNELGIDPVPSTITQCTKALKEIHVNIFDFLEARHRNNHEGDGTILVRRFPTAKALGKYSSANDKIYPREKAKRAGALKALLNVFCRPPS